MNSDSFINNTDCKYFPCHKTAHPEDFFNSFFLLCCSRIETGAKRPV